jgi:hypothetical protein
MGGAQPEGPPSGEGEQPEEAEPPAVSWLPPVAPGPGPPAPPHAGRKGDPVPKLDRTILDRLDEIPWLERCGIVEAVPAAFETCQVTSWEEVAAVSTDEWYRSKQERYNDVSRAVAAERRDLFDGPWWNVIATGARDELDARLTERLVKTFHADRMSPFFNRIPGIVKGDNLFAIVEASWAAFGCKVPSFWRDLFTLYEAGHLPCGWDGGQYPNGFLVYY